jgi:hypothetical protein
MHGFFLYSDRTTLQKTSAFHQEAHQPELMTKDQNYMADEKLIFFVSSDASTGGFFNSVGT